MRTVIAVLFAASTLAVPAQAQTERRCGSLKGEPSAPQDVRASGVACATARSLASKHNRSSGRNERCDLAKRSCRLDGWTCARSFFGNAGTRVRCTRGDARVRFFYGV